MRADSDDERGLNQITEYLLWNAEIEQARRQATAFTARLPWLTGAQRDDVERVYVADRVAASQAMLERICDRAGELRGEYGERYADLRKRCVAAVMACAVVAIGAATAVVLVMR